jgi:hypothetical protein
VHSLFETREEEAPRRLNGLSCSAVVFGSGGDRISELPEMSRDAFGLYYVVGVGVVLVRLVFVFN